MVQRPVVYLSFANDGDRALPMVKAESRQLLRGLRPIEKANQIEIRREESTTLEEFYEDLLYYDQRIVVLHYAGHADESRLFLEEGGGRAAGLAQLLGRQAGLRLVFLNGCSTQPQVDALLSAGVPAVIATSERVDDQLALEFADAFYLALAADKNVGEAYFLAKAYLLSSDGVFRETVSDPVTRGEIENTEIPWALQVRKGSGRHAFEWKLSEAGQATTFALLNTDGSPVLDSNDQPVRLPRMMAGSDVEQICCGRCDLSWVATASHEGDCPFCGAVELSASAVRQLDPDGWLPFSVDNQVASRRLKDYLAGFFWLPPEVHALRHRLRAVFAPFYLVDCNVEVRYRAECGLIRQQGESDWVYDWSNRTGKVSRVLERGLVSAGAVPELVQVSPRVRKFWRKPPPVAWVWNAGHLLFDDGGPRPNVSVDEAMTGRCKLDFPAVFQSFTSQLEAEVRDDIEAELLVDEIRDFVTDMRFEDLRVRLVHLPYWVGVADCNGQLCHFQVNGSTGATRGTPPSRFGL